MLTYILLTLVFLANLSAIYSNNVSVCYYRNWAQGYDGEAKFTPANIDAKLCSVINYASNQINIETFELEGRQENDTTRIQELLALKANNSALKVQVTVGGWNHEKLPRFAEMIKLPGRRETFINSTINYLITHNLDGINVDWEYPGIYTREEKKKYPKQLKKHKKLFIKLLEGLKTALEKDALNRNLPQRLMLTLAVPAARKKIKRGYNIRRINKLVDSIDIMAYNLRGPWRNYTGCPTVAQGDTPNIPDTLDAWLKGMDPSKVNLGFVSYGRTFKLKDKSATDIGVPTIGKGDKGDHTDKKGILAYYEICKKKWSNKVSGKDSSCGAPYASDNKNGVWVGYDDPASIRDKVKRLVNKRKLNGISFWALDFDDFKGTHCGQGRYPLLKAAVDAMNE